MVFIFATHNLCCGGFLKLSAIDFFTVCPMRRRFCFILGPPRESPFFPQMGLVQKLLILNIFLSPWIRIFFTSSEIMKRFLLPFFPSPEEIVSFFHCFPSHPERDSDSQPLRRVLKLKGSLLDT